MKTQDRYCASPYYRRNPYDYLRKIAMDKDTFSMSYDEMRAITEARYHEMEESGFKACKIDFDAEELSDWCNRQGVGMNPASRTRFAMMKLKKLIDTSILLP
jgi:hypothetical protein